MLNIQQILNKVFRNEQGEISAEILQLQQIFNHIFDESKNALRISGISVAGLLKTGQTTSYETADDGDLELGIAHSYEILTTGQYSGTTNIVINGKTHALSNNCVKDNNTKLMWARYVPNADIGPAADGKLFWKQWTLAAETVTFTNVDGKITADAGTPFNTSALCAGRKFTIANSGAGNNGTRTVAAITTSVITTIEGVNDEASIAISFATVDDLIWDFLDQANANSFGGYTDWRIPNYHELLSIVDLDHCNPAIDTTVFPSTPTTSHWIASTNPCNSAHAFYVDFSNGSVDYSIKEAGKYYVRLVRS
jgi:hypothetical protein